MTLQEAIAETERLRAEYACSGTAKRSIALLTEVERLQKELRRAENMFLAQKEGLIS